MGNLSYLPVIVGAAAWGFSLSATAVGTDYPGLGPKGSLVRLEFDHPEELVLRGRNDRAQLLLSGKYSSGQTHDQTHDVVYHVAPAGIVQVDSTGLVAPLADGTVKITAAGPDGPTASIPCRVEGYATPRPINFANEIVPIFTKLGCNAGACHGKSEGQNGFKLSLLGFEPEEDYEWLVKEHRGRRIFPAVPELSLVITKPTNRLPHGGGQRLEEGSYPWELLLNWIEQGTPYGSEDDPVVQRIEVYPAAREMNCDARQQLRVAAHYSDGASRDVTRLATYESIDREMAEASATGLVHTLDRPGDVAVMVRFQGQVGVFRASMPLGVKLQDMPPERNAIDRHVFGKLKKLGIPPSPPCDDATFVRRVYLDLTGRLPTAGQTRQFIADSDSGKRDKLIDFLLESPGYGDYFAGKWAMVLRNKRVANNTAVSFRFHEWVRRAIQQNMPYDEFVGRILAATGDVENNPPVSWYMQVNTATAQAEDTAQLFLGLRIQCARCHHHPFEKWDQNDYYSYQAFFSQVGTKPSRNGAAGGNVFHKGAAATAQNPRTREDRKPAGLGSPPLDLPPFEDPRVALVDWMAGPGNPFFARALVNRYWKHFFGRGLVEPEDDMRVTNPPSNPELLDGLAQEFIESGYDLKNLVRTICRSTAYQLSSEPNAHNKHDKQNFSSFYPRRLHAEVLYDAVHQVTGTNVTFAGLPAGTLAVQLPDSGFNDYFLTVFGKPQAASACECERSAEANLAQSLHLLNSTDIQSKLASPGGQAEQLAKDVARSDVEKITELYYAAMSRPPRQDESELVLGFLQRQKDKKRAFEDILWALINTKEFLFNH